MRLAPDGTLGAIVGSESLWLTETLVNGAGGCRSRAQILLHGLIPECDLDNAAVRGSGYYGRQARLPCSYINGDDIVFGTAEKVSDGVASAKRFSRKDVLLVDTLGASLVCTDGSSLDPEPILLEGDLSAMSFDEGYDLASETVLRSADIGGGEDPMAVNIMGYGICDLGWTYGAEELRSLLSMMGVSVCAFLGCRPSAEEVRSSGSAALDVMLNPSRCRRTADLYRRERGIPALRPSAGAPVGYRATGSLLIEIGEALGADPSPALDALERDEAAVRRMLLNEERAVDGLRARRFSAAGESCTLLPLVTWMTEVFCMVPGAVRPTDTEYGAETASYLEGRGFGRALGARDHPETEVFFTDGVTALEGRVRGGVPAMVEISMPRGRLVDLTGRCLVGRPGCRYILDETINGITRFRCAQLPFVEDD